MTEAGGVLVSMIAAAASGGMAANLGAAAAGSVGANATLQVAVQAGTTSMVTGAASSFAVSAVNNRGNLAKATGETLSAKNLERLGKSSLISGVSAGVINGVGLGNLSEFDGMSRYGVIGAREFISEGVASAIEGRKFSVGSVVSNTALASAQNKIGDIAQDAGMAEGSAGKVAMHGAVGGVFALSQGGDFAVGALASGIAEASMPYIASSSKPSLYGMYDPTKARAGLVAAGVSLALAPKDAGSMIRSARVAESSVMYNRELHDDERMVLKAQNEGKLPEEIRDNEDAALASVEGDALYFIKMVTSSGFEANPDTLQHLELVMTGEGAKLPAELNAF